MKLWVISDLHLLNSDPKQFGSRLKIPRADLCVMAGDICDNGDLEAGLRWIAAIICPHMPVIFVRGNHDGKGMALKTLTKRAREIAAEVVIIRDKNGDPVVDESGKVRTVHPIYVLDDDSELIAKKHGVRFIGCPLWTDFAIMAPEDAPEDVVEAFRAQALSKMRQAMPEYQTIFYDEDRGDGEQRYMNAYDAFACHEDSKKALIEKLSKPFAGATVVVTHHAPHPKSISTYFGKNSLTPAFVSDLTDVIQTYQPDLWVHGHIHENFDYPVGKTRIYCHALGGGNPKFSWQGGLIDIPSQPDLAMRL